MFDTSSWPGANIGGQPTGNKILISIDAPITAPVMHRTISGLIFTPLVSSSKNLKRPALEAGSGAFFFLLLIDCRLFFPKTCQVIVGRQISSLCFEHETTRLNSKSWEKCVTRWRLFAKSAVSRTTYVLAGN